MASQAAAATVLDSVILKVLHAHNFSRTSSQASVVLTNLVSRYLVLLSSVSGSYAELAGRSKVNMWDVLSSLGDLGMTLEELDEYSSSEGKELGRYASSSTRRLDDLLEFRSNFPDYPVHRRLKTNHFTRLS
jgi:histone H3/H4